MATVVKPKPVMSGHNGTMSNGVHNLDEVDEQAGSDNEREGDSVISESTTPAVRKTTLTEKHETDLREYYSKKLEVPPSKSVGNPANVYPQTPGFESVESGVDVYKAFCLQHPDGTAITSEEREKALDLTKKYFDKTKKTYMGYQVNQDQDFAESLGDYLNMHVRFHLRLVHNTIRNTLRVVVDFPSKSIKQCMQPSSR